VSQFSRVRRKPAAGGDDDKDRAISGSPRFQGRRSPILARACVPMQSNCRCPRARHVSNIIASCRRALWVHSAHRLSDRDHRGRTARSASAGPQAVKPRLIRPHHTPGRFAKKNEIWDSGVPPFEWGDNAWPLGRRWGGRSRSILTIPAAASSRFKVTLCHCLLRRLPNVSNATSVVCWQIQWAGPASSTGANPEAPDVCDDSALEEGASHQARMRQGEVSAAGRLGNREIAVQSAVPTGSASVSRASAFQCF